MRDITRGSTFGTSFERYTTYCFILLFHICAIAVSQYITTYLVFAVCRLQLTFYFIFWLSYRIHGHFIYMVPLVPTSTSTCSVVFFNAMTLTWCKFKRNKLQTRYLYSKFPLFEKSQYKHNFSITFQAVQEGDFKIPMRIIITIFGSYYITFIIIIILQLPILVVLYEQQHYYI